MANTPNLDLVKPAGTDKALVSVINSNSDKIDAGFGSLSDQITNKTTETLSSSYATFQNDAFLQKIGNLVILQLVFKPTQDITRWTTFMTIPEGFRPNKTIFGADIQSTSAGDHFEIYTSGDVQASFNMPNDTQRRTSTLCWFL